MPVSLPYRNFIARTHAIDPAVHENFFREQLAEIDEPTAPFGLLDVRDDGASIEEACLALDDDLSRSIRDAARKHGVTPAVVFHVAWAQVLALCTGRDDLVFGTVVSGRLQAADGANGILGMFINTLPVRVCLAGRGAATALTETYRRLSGLLGHEPARWHWLNAAAALPPACRYLRPC